ncbi:MAG: hypothetical protein NC110_02040 [Ruminococcus sp.]|nr:hypothetical protein [Ruminococcus sp.]
METNQTTPVTTTQETKQNKKIMTCKTCGTPMAKNAKRCPSCGAKNPRKRIRKLITLLVIVGLIAGYFLYLFISASASATITIPSGEKFTKTEFYSTYREYILNDRYNEFVSECLPANIVVKGKITKLDDTTVGVKKEYSSIHLEKGAHRVMKIEIENQYIYEISYDLYDKAENHNFGKLRVGDKVTAIGVISPFNTVTPENYIRESLPGDLKIIGGEEDITRQ